MRINLGCGSDIAPGYVNLDRVAGPGVEVVHDLDRLPWPFEDDSADFLLATDVFEHVSDAIGFMTECHRILMPNCHLRLHTPHWRSADAFTDPTHKRFPTEHTFDYWIPGTVLSKHNAAYGGVWFDLVALQPDGGSMDVILAKLVGAP